MNTMIDVHILNMPNDRQDWAKQCETSLAQEPVIVHNLDGVIGNVGAGRALGFAQGNLPFVSYVDPDDYVLPGGFAACAKILTDHPQISCVGTREYRIGVNGEIPAYNRSHSGPHHLLVFRRDAILPELDRLSTLPHAPEPWLMARLKQRFGHCALWLIDEPYYVWRVHDQGWHLRTRVEHASFMRRLREKADGLDLA